MNTNKLMGLLIFGCAMNTQVSVAESTLSTSINTAQTYLSSHANELGFSESDIADAQVLSSYVTKHNGMRHIVFRQYVNGIEVNQADVQINLDKNDRLINVHSQFIDSAASKSNSLDINIAADEAILLAAQYLNITTSMPSYRMTDVVGLNQSAEFAGLGISKQNIPVKLVYQAGANRQPVLTWDMQIIEGQNWWNIQVDTKTGKIIGQSNWSAHASYDVIPLPNESPATNGFQLETEVDPHDLTASQFGWHDTNGAAGAEFTDTRGNNVFAQDDLDANDFGGTRPDGGVDLEFTVPWNPVVNPDEEQNLGSAIVNLFYWNNIMHDVMYQYGFDEGAGNFQENNYGNAGNGSDSVNADALDGSDTNNANFGTPPDGSNPRMQMFLWNAPPGLFVTAPLSIEGQYVAGGASFGAAYTQAGVSGIVEQVNDNDDSNGGSFSDGCTALTGFTPGQVALIDRGACEFGLKVLNAENAGAIAAIVVNNAGDGVITMGGGVNGGSVGITALMVGQSDGDLIKAELANDVNVELKKIDVDRDSDFDNGIIIHEYGHGISNRLTGGPGASSCLQNREQMGEGWSDFFALVMTAVPGDTAEQLRPIGTYAGNNASGIRTYPYTTSMTDNLHTFISVADAIQTDGSISPHLVGSVWAEMLWEMYWLLVDEYGYDADLYNGTGGNNLALQLVIDGLKLQQCSPGFVNGRDAILQADQLNNAGANQCEIWTAFAKRGLGEGASSGSNFILDDETESFVVPVSACIDDLIFEDGFE